MNKWKEYNINNLYLEIQYTKFIFFLKIKKEKNDLLKIYKEALSSKNLKKEKKYIVGLHLITNKKIKKMNHENRNINKVTDVLSFPLNYDNKIEGFYFGDIFINKNILRKQSKEINSNKSKELKFLFMHGLLHLLGYDHNNQKNEKIMIEEQKRIFKKLGIK